MRRLLIALLCALSLLGRARAEPRFVRLSLVGDPSSSMGVAWNSRQGTRTGWVVYGTRSGDYPSRASARLSPWSDQVIAEAVLGGLRPSTLYYYRVADEGGRSPEHSFRSAAPLDPSCGRLRFVFLGDSRAESWQGSMGASSLWPLLLTRAATRLPSFIVHGGDIVQNALDPRQWQNHLRGTAPVSGYFPILYALGNHDDGPGQGEEASFNQLLQLPRSEPALGGRGLEDYYAFRYGNALFVVLSTETFHAGAMREQAAFLDRVLARNPARWRFVFLHRPLYTHESLVAHPGNELGHRATLLPVIHRHRVDLVFASHNHFYERFAASRCSDASSNATCPVAAERGTVYVTSGGAGAFPILYAGAVSVARPAASGRHHYVLVEIVDHRLSLRALTPEGHQLDALVMDRAGGSRCGGEPRQRRLRP